MTALALLLLAAAVAHAVARLTRLPVIPLFVLAGLLLGLTPYGANDDFLRTTVELGLVFLVFSAGVELSPRRIGQQSRRVWGVGAAQFIVIGAGAWVVAQTMGFDFQSSLFLALAIAASSTLVVTAVLKQRQQMFEPFGRLVTGVLLLQDAAVVLMLVLLARLPEGAAAVVLALAGTGLLIVCAWLAQRYLMPWLSHRKLDDESLLLGALAVLFSACGFALWLGVPLIAGAFLAGITLSGFPINGLVRGMLGSLSDFFLALFFVALGGLLVLPSPTLLSAGLALGVFVIVATVPLVTLVAERLGLSTRASIESGLLLAQTSEFSIVIALQGLALGVISAELFSMVALLTVATMALTPALSHPHTVNLLVRCDPRRLWQKRPHLTRAGHIVFIGVGAAGERFLAPVLATGCEIVVVDEDASLLRRIHARENPKVSTLQGDGSLPAMLERVQARRAAAVVCSLPRPEQSERVARHLKGSGARVIIRAFDPALGRLLADHGALPVVTSEAAAESFMAWATNEGLVGKTP